MTNTSIVVASCNTPQGHADEISLSPAERVDFLVKILNAQNVQVITLQEYGPALDDGWAKHARWSVIKGLNNNRPDQRIAMNAIAYRKGAVKPLDIKHMSFNLKGRQIHVPVVLFEEIATGATFVVFGVHVPTRRDASEAKRLEINLRILSYARKCERRGHTVIVAGDRNDGHLPPWIPGSGFKRAIQNMVDWIIVNKATDVIAIGKAAAVWRKVTDHHALIFARLSFKANTDTPDNLP